MAERKRRGGGSSEVASPGRVEKPEPQVVAEPLERMSCVIVAEGEEDVWVAPVEFVTGQTGRRKTRARGPFPRPAPLNGLGQGVFFSIPCPCPR